MLPLPRDERGFSESLQLAVVWPVLMLLTLGVIEGGLWLHARNVAERAAVAAVGAAGGSYGSVDAARELGHDLAASGGLSEVSVQVTRGPAEVTVVVSAGSPLVLDLGLARIRETASGPVERVTGP